MIRIKVSFELLFVTIIIATIIENIWPDFFSPAWFCVNLLWLCEE